MIFSQKCVKTWTSSKREYYLHQQMKTIQEELGGVSHDEEIEEMRELAKKKKWRKEVGETFEKELRTLTKNESTSG